MKFLDILGFCSSQMVAEELLSGFAPLIVKDYSGPDTDVFPIDFSPGVCFCLVVLDEKFTKPFFNKAFLFPLRWRKASEDSALLPPAIVQAANQVRQDVAIAGWGIHPHELLHGMDFSDTKMSVESVWPSLATALVLAENGGAQYSHIFATGKWTRYGMAAVGGIAEKIEAVVHSAPLVCPYKKPVLFLPEKNHSAVRYPEDVLEIKTYPSGQKNWRDVLGEHLRELQVPPNRSDPLELRLKYANQKWVRQSRAFRRKYYLTNLVDDLAMQLRKKSGMHFHRIAMGLGKNYEVAVLLLKALNPQKACLICTKPGRDDSGSEKYFELITAHYRRVEKLPLVLGKEEEILPELTSFLDVGGSELCAVEITGGTKSMTALMIVGGHRANTKFLYLEHQTEQGQPIFGTERIRELDWISKMIPDSGLEETADEFNK